MAPRAPGMSIAQQNAVARGLVLQNSVKMTQQIYSQAIDPSSSPVVNVNFKNIGLVLGFLVKITGTIRNYAAATVANRTEHGASNLLTNVQMTDFQNTVRIATAGWHLALVNSAKEPMVFGGAYQPNLPENFGSNFPIMTAPATIAAVTDAAISYYYWVPCAYGGNDLTGAIYAGLVNATANLQLTLNANPGGNSADDTVLKLYEHATGAADVRWKDGTTVQVTVFQVYLDQLPMNNGLPILPPQDINTIYELKNTTLSALVENQDFNIPYANFRSFLSTTVIYDNGGTLNDGDDINYWALIAANSQQIFKYGPDEAALFARGVFRADLPLGTYYFDSRSKPINTQQYGNQNLVLNASDVQANAACLVGFEDFAQVQTILQYGSLPNS
jgi:P3 major capsid protein